MPLKLLAALAAAYVLLVAVLWATQERMVFPGARGIFLDPVNAGFMDAERVTVESHDGIPLRGWFIPAADSIERPTPVLLWFYGNMETVSALSGTFHYMKPPGYALLALDYRGYGENPGNASEKALEKDGEAAFEYVMARNDVDPDRIAVFGRSIGSTVAMHLASTRPVAAVILDSPMTSAADVAREKFWFFPRLLLRMELNNVARARDVSAPLLVLHGEQDTLIPKWMGQAVAEAAPDGRFVLLRDADHNSTMAVHPDRYRAEFQKHLDRVHSAG